MTIDDDDVVEMNRAEDSDVYGDGDEINNDVHDSHDDKDGDTKGEDDGDSDFDDFE